MYELKAGQVFQEIFLGLQIFNDKAKLGKPKTMDSEAVFQAIGANPTSSIRWVSGELGISLSSVVCDLLKPGKSSKSNRIVRDVTKILQNFWLTLVTLCRILLLAEVLSKYRY